MGSTGIRRNWRQIRADTPAAGFDWAIECGGQRWWRITTLVALLTTSAVVANRRVRLVASEGGAVYFVAESHLNQAASLARQYAANTGAGIAAADSTVLPLPLPSGGLVLRPGARLEALTAALDAGDQWTAIVVLAEEIPSGIAYEGDQFSSPPTTEGE